MKKKKNQGSEKDKKKKEKNLEILFPKPKIYYLRC